MKTKEELNALKEELESRNRKLAELTEEELAQVSGGGPAVRVKGDDIAKLNTTKAQDALQGRIAGVETTDTAGQPGSSSEIGIR